MNAINNMGIGMENVLHEVLFRLNHSRYHSSNWKTNKRVISYKVPYIYRIKVKSNCYLVCSVIAMYSSKRHEFYASSKCLSIDEIICATFRRSTHVITSINDKIRH